MPASSTYTPIATFTANGSTTGFNFTSIPQTYTDLVIVTYGRAGRAVVGENLLLYFNNDSGSNYSFTYLYGNGTAGGSSRASAQGVGIIVDAFTGSSAGGTAFGSGVTHIQNYANTTTFKIALGRGAAAGSGAGETALTATLWRSTAAITSINAFTYNNLVAGSTITLYGIAAA